MGKIQGEFEYKDDKPTIKQRVKTYIIFGLIFLFMIGIIIALFVPWIMGIIKIMGMIL